jgi:hypothetical protein
MSGRIWIYPAQARKASESPSIKAVSRLTVRTVREIAVLLGLMCLHASEMCDFVVYSDAIDVEVCTRP